MNEMEKYGNLEVIINQIRLEHPTMSLRSLYELIKPEGMGRDKFISYCCELGLNQVKQFKPLRTTDSSGVIRFDNLLTNLNITRINQVWSSDITYFQIGENVYYLTFILDNYSRMILGWSVSESLKTEYTTLPALKMAVKNRKGVNLKGLIFHSDGGGQYYAKIFLDYTEELKFRNSMCEYAYENGKAERINGIIKNNYLKYWKSSDLGSLSRNVDRACTNFNLEKPHKSLKKLSPIIFERNLINLQQQTKPEVMESFYGKRC